MTLKRDDNLLAYATPRQTEKLLKYWELDCSATAAADALGIDNSSIYQAIKSVQAKAARQGYSPEHEMTHVVPDGYRLKGTSTLFDKEGKARLQWVKTTIDHERQAEIIEQSFQAMANDLPKLPARATKPEGLDSRLMAVYPLGDPHIGMLSWADETGEAYDLHIAERLHCAAMVQLVELAPNCKHATIMNLGDYFHSDNSEGVTSRSGHHLDTDSRYAKMAAVGIRIMRTLIEAALTKHETVHIINVGGNHDDIGAIMLRVCLANMYANEPRITVDTSPGGFHYFRHGKVLVGAHHGHSCKADRLPGVMANDRAKDWGETLHRYWYVGHIHHQSVKDYPGVTVESFRTLAAKDAYASWGGYRAPRDMKCIVLHEHHGEVVRYSVNPAMIDPETVK